MESNLRPWFLVNLKKFTKPLQPLDLENACFRSYICLVKRTVCISFFIPHRSDYPSPVSYKQELPKGLTYYTKKMSISSLVKSYRIDEYHAISTLMGTELSTSFHAPYISLAILNSNNRKHTSLLLHPSHDMTIHQWSKATKDLVYRSSEKGNRVDPNQLLPAMKFLTVNCSASATSVITLYPFHFTLFAVPAPAPVFWNSA